MSTTTLLVGSIPIKVTFKPIKNLHLSVFPPEGKVTISSPLEYDLERIKVYAATKLKWIKNEQQKIKKQARESKRLYITNESHYLLGERYLLKVKQSDKNWIERKPKQLILHVKDLENFELKQSIFETYYREILRHRINELITVYSKRMKVEIPDFKIRKMKTNWGSCSVNQLLTFNLELAKKPIDCIEYIVVHEMIHLKERHHNKRFVLLMDEYLPNWRLKKKELNELPIGIISNKKDPVND